jgi:hypothetical protein
VKGPGSRSIRARAGHRSPAFHPRDIIDRFDHRLSCTPDKIDVRTPQTRPDGRPPCPPDCPPPWPADPVTLQESLQPVGAAATRHITWGDGSPVAVETRDDRWQRVYAKAGRFHILVRRNGLFPVREHDHDGRRSFPGRRRFHYRFPRRTGRAPRPSTSPGSLWSRAASPRSWPVAGVSAAPPDHVEQTNMSNWIRVAFAAALAVTLSTVLPRPLTPTRRSPPVIG